MEDIEDRRRLRMSTNPLEKLLTEHSISRRLAEETELLHKIVPNFAEKFAALTQFEQDTYELHRRRLLEGRRLTEADIPRSYTDTAEQVIARRRLIDGDRTPVGLSDLMDKIVDAQVRDRRLASMERRVSSQGKHRRCTANLPPRT